MAFVEVFVEEHDRLPDGCSMRFRAVGEPRAVTRLGYESERGTAGIWRVEAAHADGSRGPAAAVVVDDSGAGTAVLVHGGAHGLRLTSPDGDEEVAEAYLLVAEGAIVA